MMFMCVWQRVSLFNVGKIEIQFYSEIRVPAHNHSIDREKKQMLIACIGY